MTESTSTTSSGALKESATVTTSKRLRSALVVIVLTFRATAAALGEQLRPVFILTWGAVYALIGTQMAWVLRPWIGSWDQPYSAFRPLGGSFIETIWRLITA